MNDEKAMQDMMQKLESLKNNPLNNPTPPPQGQPSGFDNQGNNGFTQTQGAGVFDNQGPDWKGQVPEAPIKPNVPHQPNVINTTGVNQGPPPQPADLANRCPQCGMAHPPLPQGKKCPNAPVAQENDIGITDAEINKHLVEMRNIILSNMSKRGIKDGKKFFQHAILELTKALESYSG